MLPERGERFEDGAASGIKRVDGLQNNWIFYAALQGRKLPEHGEF
jgi:hypothetical protein